MQQELRRFTHRAHEQQQACQSHGIEIGTDKMELGIGQSGNFRENRIKSDRTRQHEHQKNTKCEAEIADAVDDKGLHGSGHGRRLFEPEADQQIGGQPHAFPAKEHLDQIVGCHQHQHRESEQRQIGEETRTRGILVHVSDRIQMHQSRNRIDHHQHNRRQRINAQGPFDRESAGYNPRGQSLLECPFAEPDVEEHNP